MLTTKNENKNEVFWNVTERRFESKNKVTVQAYGQLCLSSPDGSRQLFTIPPSPAPLPGPPPTWPPASPPSPEGAPTCQTSPASAAGRHYCRYVASNPLVVVLLDDVTGETFTVKHSCGQLYRCISCSCSLPSPFKVRSCHYVLLGRGI